MEATIGSVIHHENSIYLIIQSVLADELRRHQDPSQAVVTDPDLTKSADFT
jgi:hypothetical protein